MPFGSSPISTKRQRNNEFVVVRSLASTAVLGPPTFTGGDSGMEPVSAWDGPDNGIRTDTTKPTTGYSSCFLRSLSHCFSAAFVWFTVCI